MRKVAGGTDVTYVVRKAADGRDVTCFVFKVVGGADINPPHHVNGWHCEFASDADSPHRNFCFEGESTHMGWGAASARASIQNASWISS